MESEERKEYRRIYYQQNKERLKEYQKRKYAEKIGHTPKKPGRPKGTVGSYKAKWLEEMQAQKSVIQPHNPDESPQ